MADNVFFGGATSVAQEDRLTPGGTIETGDKFIVTLSGADAGVADQTIVASATGTTVAIVCADLLTAWTASTASLKSGITASNQTTYFKLLGTAGTPFYATPTTTESNDAAADAQTFIRTATMANAGAADWNTASNWSTGVVPVNSDNVYLNGRSANAITYGLNQSAVTLASLVIEESMAYAVGTITAKLRVGATKHEIGKPSTTGSTSGMSTLINLDFGTVQTTGTIHGSRNTGTSSQAPILLKGTHASNAIAVKGSAIVGIGMNTAGEAATVLTLTVKEQAKVEVGSGVTLGTLNPEGGETLLNCAVTTINYGEGTVRTEGTGTVGTATIGGNFIGNSTGTITNITAAEKGFADFGQNTAARTVTNGFVAGMRSKFSTDNGIPLSVTVTNGVDLLNGAKSSQVNYGDGVTVSQSAI